MWLFTGSLNSMVTQRNLILQMDRFTLTTSTVLTPFKFPPTGYLVFIPIAICSWYWVEKKSHCMSRFFPLSPRSNMYMNRSCKLTITFWNSRNMRGGKVHVNSTNVLPKNLIPLFQWYWCRGLNSCKNQLILTPTTQLPQLILTPHNWSAYLVWIGNCVVFDLPCSIDRIVFT